MRLYLRSLLFFAVLSGVLAVKWHAARVPHASYQAHFDEWAGKNYIPTFVAGYQDTDGTILYSAIWEENSGTTWKAVHGLTESQYQTELDLLLAEGYLPVFVDAFGVTGSSPRMTAVFHKMSTTWEARHGQSSSEYQETFTSLAGNSYDLQYVSQYSWSGTRRYASLFTRNSVSNLWVTHHGMSSTSYQTRFNDYVNDQGYALRYASVGTFADAAPQFAAIWEKRGGAAWRAYHDLSTAAMEAQLAARTAEGYVPQVIDGYLNAAGELNWLMLLEQDAGSSFVEADEKILEPEANGPTFSETACFDDKLTAFLKANGIPGASAAVLKDGRVVYAQGYGQLDAPGIGARREEPRKTLPWTPFRLASVSKPITALAVLRLVQTGALGLDDKVFGAGGLLQAMSDAPKPCCAVVDDRIYSVTVRHLLRHTGGWNRDTTFDPMFRSDIVGQTLDPDFLVNPPAEPASCTDVIFYMFGQPLQHDPGTTYKYSNFGFCILGRVIEEAAGEPYEAAVRTLLLDPAGVDPEYMYVGSTRLADIPEAEAEYYCPGCGMTSSVFPQDTEQVENPYGAWHLEAMDSHGAWVSNACQLMKVLAVTSPPHCNGTDTGFNGEACVLWSESVAAILEKGPYWAGADSYYGLGFSVREVGEGLANWWHTGSLPGTTTVMVKANAGFGYAWAFLANVRGFSGDADGLMWEAVECVGSTWPATLQTCTAEEDADECALGTDTCDAANAVCINTAGSFACACNAGWEGNGVSCSDAVECGVSDDCHANAECNDGGGTFTCTCKTGWEGNGVSCSDAVECGVSDDCHADAECNDGGGTFTCTCRAGFTGDGKTCEAVSSGGEGSDADETGDGDEDTDECADGSHNCDSEARCTDTATSFTCECNAGFSGSGVSCVAVLDDPAQVQMVVELPYTVAAFNAPAVTAGFKQGVATAAATTADKVSINEVTAKTVAATTRRLLADAVDVDFSIDVADRAQAQALVDSGRLSLNSLNSALADQDIQPAAAVVSAPAAVLAPVDEGQKSAAAVQSTTAGRAALAWLVAALLVVSRSW